MTNDFALNHDKSLQIYFCVKGQAKIYFPKDVERTVDIFFWVNNWPGLPRAMAKKWAFYKSVLKYEPALEN